jgi:4-amino-4-deoxy-L-arabinose transferase-like glycosyltransferase
MQSTITTQNNGIRWFETATKDTQIYVGLIVLTSVAVLLRFFKLDDWSFWGDEIITVNRVQSLLDGVLTFKTVSVSLLLNGIAFTLYGTNEWSARLAPALIGALSIPLLYFPLRKIIGPIAALLTVLLLVVAPWHLYWSQNARFYTTMFLFYAMALLTFYMAMEADRPLYFLLSALFLGLASVERLSALLLVPVLASYWVLLLILPFGKPAGLRVRNLVIFCLPGVIPMIIYALPYIMEPSRWWSRFVWVNNNPLWLLAGVIYYIGVPLICLAALGALFLLLQKSRFVLLLSLSAFVPLLIILVMSLFQYTANRYLFVTLFSWLILAALAIEALFLQLQRNAKLLAVGVLAILLFASLSEDVLYFTYQNGNRDNWKAAFAYVAEREAAGDLIVVANPALARYYLHENIISMERADVERLQAAGQRVWFVEDMNARSKWPHVLRWIQRHATQVAEMDVYVQARHYKMRVYLYDPQRDNPLHQTSLN